MLCDSRWGVDAWASTCKTTAGHAIAHIRRTPGRAPLRFDDEEEAARFAISTRIVQELVRHYIRTELGVINRLYLVRTERNGFQKYVDEAYGYQHRTWRVR
jgi:hypothetical protein